MKKIISITFLIILLAFILVFCCFNNKGEKVLEVESCPVSGKEVVVDGTSMSPFINPGDMVKAIYGYYSCHEILRNDVVLYDYAGNKNLLIKFVKAIPGDKWELKKVKDEYEIIVNGVSLFNYEGIPYSLTESSVKMLGLYIKDYPTIPDNTYLLLGDKTSGSMDSTRFGLVNKKEIVAKVEK